MGYSCSIVWMCLLAVAALMVVLADATTCDEVLNQEMQTCLSYVRGQGGSSATACCGAVKSLDPVDKKVACTCLTDEVIRSPVKATLGTLVSVVCPSSYSNILLVRIFTTSPSQIDCSRFDGTNAE